MPADRPFIEVTEEQASTWVDENFDRHADGSLTAPRSRNEAAHRLRLLFNTGLMVKSRDKYLVDLDAALAEERRLVVKWIRGRLFEAAWRKADGEWLDPKVTSAILDEVEADHD
jgi:hypothetical protein